MVLWGVRTRINDATLVETEADTVPCHGATIQTQRMNNKVWTGLSHVVTKVGGANDRNLRSINTVAKVRRRAQGEPNKQKVDNKHKPVSTFKIHNGGSNKVRTCDLYRVRVALIPTELCPQAILLLYRAPR